MFKRPMVMGQSGFLSLRGLMAGFGMGVAVGLMAYLLGTSWYLGRLLPGTRVADQSLGGLSVAQAQAKLTGATAKYRVQLVIGQQQFSFSPDQLGVSYDTGATVNQLYHRQRGSLWHPQPRSNQVMVYHVSTTRLKAAVDAVADEIGVQPVDASLVVAGTELKTVPEQDGYTVDRVALARLIESHLALGVSAKLATTATRQTAQIVSASLGPTISEAQSLMATPITLTYQTHTWTPTAAAIGSWLTFAKADADTASPKLVAEVDAAKLRSYVAGLAKQVDIPAVTQLTTVKNGATTVDRAGVDGVAINQAATVVAIAAALQAQQPLSYTITDGVVPFKTKVTNFTTLDLPSYVEINLSVQHLWVWQDGNIIYDSPITSGATGAGFGTAQGLFHIYSKQTNRHLVGYQYGPRYNYDVFVKYWMPFYLGYGMHDASWRNGNFGGQDYWRGGSHGCVNLPDVTAEWIYNWSEVGTPVWVHT